MKNPIFSIVVITYNQPELVAQTLDSIYNQTYKNIELIISDDCSNNENTHVIQNWLNKHEGRFIKVIFNVNDKNKGISANLSTGLKFASGEFVKAIAGDDLLYPDAIEKMADFLNENRNVNFCTSRGINFCDKDSQRVFLEATPSKAFIKKLNRLSNSFDQFKFIAAYGNGILAPATFFRRKVFENYGYPSERYKYVEDFALWLELLLKGTRIFVLNEITAMYRVHEKSITQRAYKFGNTDYYKEILQTYKEYVLPYIDNFNFFEILSVISKIKIFKELMIKGPNLNVRRKVRKYKLIDSIFYRYDLPTLLYSKFKRLYSKSRIK